MRTKSILRSTAFAALLLVVVLILSSSNITSLASGPQQGQPELQLVESETTVVTEVGSWASQSTESASGGSYLYSSGSADDALTFDFKGSTVEISYVASPHFGQFAIEIDNSVRRTVVTTSDETQFDQRAVINYLNDEVHTVRVYPVEGVIAIDAFYTVLPPHVSVDVPNGYMIIEEDIIVPVDFYDTYGEDAHPSEAYVGSSNLWPNGQIPYEFNANVDATNQGRMRAAMDEWETHAPVTFTQCAGNNCTQTYHVHVQSGSGNSSHVGYGNSNHTLNMYNWTYHTIIMHELGHTLGFWHEQSRPDRDTYVEIVWANIIDAYEYNFNIATGAGTYGIYDFDSMMHYGDCSFSIASPCTDADRTILAKPPYEDQQDNMGQRDHTSALDAEEMRHIYSGSISSAPSFSSPSANSADLTPTFTWNTVTNGTLYYLYVSQVGTGTVRINQKYTTVETGCDVSGSCSVTATTAWAEGCYNAYLQAQNLNNSGPWSSAYNFCIETDTTEPTPIAPIGSISVNPPTFQWTAGANATWYRLYVQGPSGVIHYNWHSAADAGCEGGGTCSVFTGVYEQAGLHRWWVVAWSPGGYSAWVGPTSYTQTNPVQLPGKITQIAPSGLIDDNTPTYQWVGDQWATWYRLWVGKAGTLTTEYDIWFSASQAGCAYSTGTCSVTPTQELADDEDYIWYVDAYGPLGYGPWSNAMTFTVGTVLPSAPVLISPSGTETSPLPTFSWNPSSADTIEYWLYLNTPSGAIQQYFTPAELGCSGGVGTCSSQLNTFLSALGYHSWWVRARNAFGWSDWSSGLAFNYNPPAPSPVTLVSPSGNTNDNTPTFTWNASSVATWYYLYVWDINDGDVYTDWYHISEAGCPTGTGTCSVTPGAVLKNNTHRWWVYAYNAAGANWSNYLEFTITSAGGFNSQFNGDANGWLIPGGSATSGYWYYNSAYLYTNPGWNNQWNSVYYNQTFADFDYSTKLWRTGCTTCSTSVFVRGDPTTLIDPYKDWNTGYLFNFTTSGSFSVWRLDGLSATALQGWAAAPTVNQGGAWNTLRVIAIGDTMYFYINGGLVWSGTDSTYSSDYVGLGYFQNSSGQLWSDWAVLSSLSADPAINDTVSAEQQALNEAANRQESSASPFQSGPSYAADSRNESASGPPVVNPGIAEPVNDD